MFDQVYKKYVSENKATFYNVPNLKLPGIDRRGGVAEITINGDRVNVRLSQEIPGTSGADWKHVDQEMSLEDFEKHIKPMLQA